MKQFIYGKNTVYEVLKSNQEIYRIFLTESFKDGRIEKLLSKSNIKTIVTSKNGLNKLVGNVVHQNIVAEVKGYEYTVLEDILDNIHHDDPPLLVMLDGLEDPHNLGAILRTCDAIGVDGVILGKNRSVGLSPTVAKVSTGAIDFVPVAQVTNLSRTLENLKKKGFWIIGCDLNNSSDYRSVDYNMPTVIVIGSEGQGISKLVKEKCDFNVILPMTGHVQSLNASVATGIILYQVYQSRHPLKQ